MSCSAVLDETVSEAEHDTGEAGPRSVPLETAPARGTVEHETVIDDAPSTTRSARIRMIALAVLFVGSIVVAKLTGVTEWLTIERVRELMTEAGALGFLAFVGLFAAGELMHVPGLVFVGAASIAYGKVLGIVASYTGAIVSVAVSFVLIRTIGGQPLGAIKRPFLRKILSRLETQPIRTVILLRMLLWLTPALNYVLAMSKVRFRDFMIGSAIGLVAPVVIAVLFFDWLAQFLG